MKNYKVVLIGIFIMLIVGFSQCEGQPSTPYNPDVVDHKMGNGVHCYTWRAQLECLQVSE